MKKRLGFDLILLGAPAAGKDTQAILLERKFAFKPVESGKYAIEYGKWNSGRSIFYYDYGCT